MPIHAQTKEIRFGDLYSTPSRNGVSKPKRMRGNGFPMVNMGEIFEYNKIDDATPMDLVPLSDKELESGLLEYGDLLFARQSLVAEGAGKSILFLGQKRKTTFESHLIRVRLKKDLAEPIYYYYYFLSPVGKAKIKSLVMQVAAAGIRGSELENLSVDYLPIQSQKIIASTLFLYDQLIENNCRRIKILEQLAQAIYTEWFIHFRFPGHEKIKMIDSGTDLGEIPEGWSVGTLSDLVEIRKEGIDPKVLTPSTAYIGIEHLPRKSWGFSDYARASDAQSNKLKFYKGDILFGNIRPYFHKVLLSPMDGICSSDIVILKPKSLGFLGLAFSTIFSEKFISQATTTSKGTKMPRADWNALINYQITIPSSEFLEMFQSVFSNFTEFTRLLNLSNKNLQDCRDMLLPKLVTGEIKI